MAEPYRDAGHLPKRRPDGRPAPPDELPRQRRGTTPQMIGRYPDYDILDNAGHWDPVTREVVLARVEDPPPLRFFDDREARTLGAFLDTVLAQDREPRIPVLHMVDAKLADGRLDGYRYADLPEDPETWRRVARGLDEAAGGDFDALPDERRRALAQRFRDGELTGGVWNDTDPSRAWSVVLRAALAAFYSHPWAWNEIGYGGPRYPRGYLRLGPGQEEPDMADERFSLDPVPDTRQRGLE
ncbi:MAG TPA: gluconate 2-dehydrogenase subunit 3 family protein [Baekduia sp.]|uniref:gluconate 2-dehydrogenase subunit 3 family protein n=1 Tax=Baekduia sp. TaxID=2600305 RepID=UPI002D7766FE|nr:gluconate 2-dehydrogenase subunit 3 family protein [Baekduia sp.]HET6505435.1 gluconate 2-dehydrogenase subunit 3 family protein [Baekduia sp.]